MDTVSFISDSSKVDDVRGRLLMALLLGEYLPGSRLPAERDLSQTLGVARETMRVALQTLTDDGLLDVRRGRSGGYFVTYDRAKEGSQAARALSDRLAVVRETIEGIGRMEALVAESAATRCTPDCAELLHERLRGFHSASSGLAKQQADARLHMAIYETAKAPALVDALMFLERRVSLSTPAHIWGMEEDHVEFETRAGREHDELIGYIVSGDAAAAATRARTHVLIDVELMERARERAERAARELHESGHEAALQAMAE